MPLSDAGFAFICYKHDPLGTQAAEKVEQFLRPRGIKTWRDTAIPAGADWDTELSQAIEAAEVLILLWSESANKSKEVKAEWNRMLKRERKIYVIKLDATELPHRLDYLQPLGDLDEEETLNKLLKVLKAEIGIKSWISEMPFVESIEEDFANCLSAENVTWFYNPYPIGGNPRFLIQGFPNFPKDYYSAVAVSNITLEIEEAINELSDNRELLVAQKLSKKRSEAYFVSMLLKSFDVWLVENGIWEAVIQCQACGELQLGELFVPHVKDDLLSDEIGIFEEWCPICEASCGQCGRKTTSFTIERGLCEACQADFDHNIRHQD
ncbi:MAG: toll/interleukin-1 receptor domain-containing protein [Anaerolineae bacterium]|nr:toll/interleukin-1 receptor domain-containing protein [Anaerolineae bacterium]